MSGGIGSSSGLDRDRGRDRPPGFPARGRPALRPDRADRIRPGPASPSSPARAAPVPPGRDRGRPGDGALGKGPQDLAVLGGGGDPSDRYAPFPGCRSLPGALPPPAGELRAGGGPEPPPGPRSGPDPGPRPIPLLPSPVSRALRRLPADDPSRRGAQPRSPLRASDPGRLCPGGARLLARGVRPPRRRRGSLSSAGRCPLPAGILRRGGGVDPVLQSRDPALHGEARGAGDPPRPGNPPGIPPPRHSPGPARIPDRRGGRRSPGGAAGGDPAGRALPRHRGLRAPDGSLRRDRHPVRAGGAAGGGGAGGGPGGGPQGMGGDPLHVRVLGGLRPPGSRGVVRRPSHPGEGAFRGAPGPFGAFPDGAAGGSENLLPARPVLPGSPPGSGSGSRGRRLRRLEVPPGRGEPRPDGAPLGDPPGPWRARDPGGGFPGAGAPRRVPPHRPGQPGQRILPSRCRAPGGGRTGNLRGNPREGGPPPEAGGLFPRLPGPEGGGPGGPRRSRDCPLRRGGPDGGRRADRRFRGAALRGEGQALRAGGGTRPDPAVQRRRRPFPEAGSPGRDHLGADQAEGPARHAGDGGGAASALRRPEGLRRVTPSAPTPPGSASSRPPSPSRRRPTSRRRSRR